jgi:hypothetical protein
MTLGLVLKSAMVSIQSLLIHVGDWVIFSRHSNKEGDVCVDSSEAVGVLGGDDKEEGKVCVDIVGKKRVEEEKEGAN